MPRCHVEKCLNQSARGGLCWGHVKRRQHHREVDVALARYEPKQAVLTAIERFYDELETGDEARAWNRLRVSMRRYVLADKPNNPHRRQASERASTRA